MIKDIEIPEIVKKILSHLASGGFEGYIVGGCVRDHLLGKVPKDWDITTDALPEQVKEIFKNAEGFRTADTGIQHGTVTVIADHIGYEVTTYRIDGEYKDSRHPESVTFTSDITGDLARRDFTMNAVAYSPENGFVDPFGGMEDIKKKLIRGVGIAADRFDEDALRMMRALRFSAQLDFEIESRTYNAITKKAPLIKNISTERIRDEFVKLLMTDNPRRLWDLWECGILPLFLPKINPDSDMLEALERSEKNLAVRTAIVMRGTEDTENTLRALTYDNKTAKYAAMLVKNENEPKQPTAYHMRSLISRIGTDGTDLLLAYKKALFGDETKRLYEIYDKIAENGDCCSIKQLAISGEDLIAAGVPRGKLIGEMLGRALEIVMQDPSLNTKTELKKRLRKH